MQKQITIRKAIREDVPEIVRLLADDILGSKRENKGSGISQRYYDAFDHIHYDANQLLMIAEIERKPVGTFQISYITNMSHQGARRAMIEGVRVEVALRGQGIGQVMMEWAIIEAKAKGCRFIQLTSNKQRKEAHRFYERLGFVASHEGFKLDLES